VPDESVDDAGGRPASVAPPARSSRTLTPAVVAALVVLAASFALSVAFVLANGGLDLPAAAQRSPESSAAVVPTSPDTAAPSTQPSVLASPSPAASAAPASLEPTPSASAEPATPGPHPSSDRYDLLTPCPSTLDCWVYVVRQGDNLVSIARYFGVPLKVVQERNPWTNTTPLVAGQKLLLPPPTR
jgi:hypothetical protein